MSVFSNRLDSTPEEREGYVSAVLGLLGDDEPMVVLESTPSFCSDLISGLTPAQLAKVPDGETWSVTHVLRHLSDSELVWGYRIRRVLAEDRPILEGYDQDSWAERLGYEGSDAQPALTTFGAIRASNLDLIRNASREDLLRVGRHKERGEESLVHMIKLYAGHDLAHRNQLGRICKLL